MTTYIPGAQHTGNILQAERVTDIPNEIFWLQKDISPLLHISAGKGPQGLPAKKKLAINPEFKVLEKEPHAAWTAINAGAGYTAGDTTLTCDDVTHLNVWDVCRVVGGEVVMITAKSNGDSTITVTRAFGATAAGAIADNTPLYKIGTANEEFGSKPNVLMVQNRPRTNYLQIFKKVIGLSRTAQNSEMYGGKKLPELRQEGMIEIKKDIERSFLLSEPYENLTGGPGGKPIRATGGAYYWTTTGGGYTETATTTYTKTMWTSFVRNCFLKGSDTKIALCSPLIIDMLSYWKDNNLRFEPSDEFYDIRVAEWITGHGRLIIMRDLMLENSPAGSGAGYGGMAMVVDPENLDYRYLGNSDLKLYENAVIDGADGRYDIIMGEIGLGYRLPETMAVLEAVSSYA